MQRRKRYDNQISVRVSESMIQRMRRFDIDWSIVLRQAIEDKLKVAEETGVLTLHVNRTLEKVG